MEIYTADAVMSGMGSIVNSHTVRFERVLPAPVDVVWEHLTSASGIKPWLKADAILEPCDGSQIELRFETPDPVNNHLYIVRGLVSEYSKPRTFAFSWFEIASDLSSNVHMQLDARGHETFLVLTHTRIAPDFMPKVGAGWHAHLDTLSSLLRGEEPIDFLPVYNELVQRYAAVLAAGIVLSTAVSPAVAASSDNSYKALYEQRSQLLSHYDRVWKESDNLKGKIDLLKRDIHQDVGQPLDYLERDLKQKIDELKRIELSVRDLDRSLID